MSIQELIDYPMPKYSKKEEIFNTISHLIGIILGVCFLFFGLYLSFQNNLKIIEMLSLILFAVSTIALYSVSTIYHGLKKDSFSKKIMRVIDHCTIYFLIAGTYTPICVIVLQKDSEGMIILILQWIFAIIGIILNAVALNKKTVEIISLFLYLITGWMIIVFPKATSLLPSQSFFYILLGGILYTIGSILYGIGSKKKWFHCIFHVFCILGTLAQAIGIFLLI